MINSEKQKNKQFKKKIQSIQRAELFAWLLFVVVGLAYIFLTVLYYNRN
jgi:hypothetical protein